MAVVFINNNNKKKLKSCTAYPFLFFALFLLFFLSCNQGFSQKTKNQLEREKKNNLKKIAETNKILQETSGEKNATIGKLNAISAQITSRKQFIQSINNELDALNAEILEIDQLSISIEGDLDNLKKEYAALIYASAKASQGFNKLAYLFSSSNFNQLIMRLNYLQQYTKARQNQKEQIDKVRKTLDIQKRKKSEKKYEKQLLLQTQTSESRNLVVLREQHDDVVKQLSARELELKDEIEESQRAVEKLENLIAELVEREIKKARDEAERIERNRRNNLKIAEKEEKHDKTEKEKLKNTIHLNAEDAVLAGTFGELKSKMMWPVKSGFISEHFGVHPHPLLKGITIKSDGITIQTNKGEEVRAVYDGVVRIVQTIPGVNKVVAIKHGDFFTVYSRLTNVNVQPGQKIKATDPIGQVMTTTEGVTEMQFQIWKNTEKLNPENWLIEK